MFSWIIVPVWFILPAYMGNTTPIFVKKINFLDYPLDFKNNFRGKRIFGDNKTWRGLVFGVIAGILTASLQGRGFAVGLVLGFGALLGDLVGSGIKRRINLDPGHPNLILDQTFYVLIPMLLYALFWEYPLSIMQSLYLLMLSMWLHRASNILYFKLGIKEVPH